MVVERDEKEKKSYETEKKKIEADIKKMKVEMNNKSKEIEKFLINEDKDRIEFIKTQKQYQLEAEQGVIMVLNQLRQQKFIPDSLRKELECLVCLEIIKEPTLTKCGHSFCNDCIRKVLNTQKECPVCRDEQNLEDLCANHILRKLIDSI